LNEDYVYTVLGLPDPVDFKSLSPPTAPESAQERELLVDLEARFRQRLAERIAQEHPQQDRPLDLGPNLGPHPGMNQFGPDTAIVFAERGPVKDRYIHYTPVFGRPSCILVCHAPVGGTLADTNDPVALA